MGRLMVIMEKKSSLSSLHVEEYLKGAAETPGEILQSLRMIILDYDPRIIEEYKWSNPVYSYLGIMLYLRAFKSHATLGFFNGHEIPDPEGRLEGAENPKLRSIRYKTTDEIDEEIVREYIDRAMRANERLKKKR